MTRRVPIRTARRRSIRMPVALGSLLVAAAVVVACGVPLDSSARVTDADDVPYDLLASTTTTVLGANAQGDETSICLAINGSVLSVGRDRSGEPPLDTLLELVLAGPTEGEASLGLRSALSTAGMVNAVVPLGDMAQVQLGSDFALLPGDQQLLAVAQMTCTLTTQADVERVSFTLAGKDIEVPIEDGSIVSRPVTRADYAKLIAN